MLNIEGMSAEAKIGKVLILVSVVLGILAVIVLGVATAAIRPSGSLSGFGVVMEIPFWILATLLALKCVGVTLGIIALYYSEKNQLSKAGILAAISSVLPPIDLIMLIGGIFCLISREANEVKSSPPPPPH
jgi:ABC-type dipeptide/oligopeptide/nickel transport system permease component